MAAFLKNLEGWKILYNLLIQWFEIWRFQIHTHTTASGQTMVFVPSWQEESTNSSIRIPFILVLNIYECRPTRGFQLGDTNFWHSQSTFIFGAHPRLSVLTTCDLCVSGRSEYWTKQVLKFISCSCDYKKPLAEEIILSQTAFRRSDWSMGRSLGNRCSSL